MNGLSLQVGDAIATVTFDQPESKVNILSRSMWADLDEALRQVGVDDTVRGLVLTSGKPGVFMAGADLKELASATGVDHSPARALIETGRNVLNALENMPFPTVACIDGAALGGGLELGLACDYRLAGTHPKARVGLPEVALGLIPGWGGTQRLPRIAGPTTAIEMIVQCFALDAETARYRGVVSRVVPSENLMAEAKLLLTESLATGAWQSQRERKRRPLEIDRSGLTIEAMNEGKVSEAKLNAMSLSPEALAAFRENVKPGPQRQAALTAIGLVEKGCLLPLSEALELEMEAFLRLVDSAEAQQLIANFFASRKQ
jgi:enoyl-CoA hydratase